MGVSGGRETWAVEFGVPIGDVIRSVNKVDATVAAILIKIDLRTITDNW